MTYITINFSAKRNDADLYDPDRQGFSYSWYGSVEVERASKFLDGLRAFINDYVNMEGNYEPTYEPTTEIGAWLDSLSEDDDCKCDPCGCDATDDVFKVFEGVTEG